MEVEYSEDHWKILKEKRQIAIRLLEMLMRLNMKGYVYGSVARGDIKVDSDIDIVILEPNIIKLDLIEAHHKFIIQATPFSTPKAYISLDEEEKIVISFPLSKLKSDELEFYWFGGLIDYDQLIREKRIPGINKKLELILPTDKGHVQIPVRGNEDFVASTLNISVNTVRKRVELLTRREERGHTGTFIKFKIDGDDSLENAIRYLYKSNKFFRRVIDSRI